MVPQRDKKQPKALGNCYLKVCQCGYVNIYSVSELDACSTENARTWTHWACGAWLCGICPHLSSRVSVTFIFPAPLLLLLPCLQNSKIITWAASLMLEHGRLIHFSICTGKSTYLQNKYIMFLMMVYHALHLQFKNICANCAPSICCSSSRQLD